MFVASVFIRWEYVYLSLPTCRLAAIHTAEPRQVLKKSTYVRPLLPKGNLKNDKPNCHYKPSRKKKKKKVGPRLEVFLTRLFLKVQC